MRSNVEILTALQKKYPSDHKLGSVICSIPGDERIAQELLELFLNGLKWAGSSIKKAYFDPTVTDLKEPLPKVGDVWLIQDLDQVVRVIARTVEVEEFAFADVSERLAQAEGEGDKTIAYWKDAHRDFFEHYLRELEIKELDSEMMIAEYFEVFRLDETSEEIVKVS